MTIKEHADKLQTLINTKMDSFCAMGKKAKELKQKLEQLHLQMGETLKELEPVDALIRVQHPEKCELFDALLKIVEDNNGR